jgi:hypothetical protein
MPLDKDTGESGSKKYCSYCAQDGKLIYDGDLKGFQAASYIGMREGGMGWLKAKIFTWMIRFAPRWKN